MKPNELEAFILLTKRLVGSPSIVMIESDWDTTSILQSRDDAVIYSISNTMFHSSDRNICILGSGLVVGRSWLYSVDMVLIDNETSEEYLERMINVWMSRVINKGIFVFRHYDESGWEHVRPIVDRKMNRFQQIAHAGNLVAYEMIDEVAQISWSMMQKNFERYEAIQ